MSTSDQVRAILGGTIQAYRNDPAYRDKVEDVRLLRPWRWHLTKERAYLVCAVHWRRR